ncbi:type VII secretion protein EssB/YukC [Mollicutes bacterium LVI A0039]|nr:type VII secretion protein EssB/YukC [Mollicutes bacterium LVI A0039]
MEKQYRKSDLNIIEDNNELLLVFKHKNLVDCEIKLSTQENILMQYNILGDSLDSINLTKIERLELLYRLAIIIQNELQMYEFHINPENIYLEIDNNPRILEKKIKIDDNDDQLLREYKSLSGHLLVKGKAFEELLDLDNSELENIGFISGIATALDFAEIEVEITKLLEAEKNGFRATKVVVDKKKYQNLRRNKGMYRLAIIATISIILFLAIYIIPFKSNVLEMYDSFVASEYSAVTDVLKDVSVNRLSRGDKYIAAVSTIRTQEQLNQAQKERILNQIDQKTDNDILEFWVYIGQGNYENAVDRGISVNDADMQIYALIMLIDEAQNDESLDAKERKELVDNYSQQVESLNKQKAELDGDE